MKVVLISGEYPPLKGGVGDYTQMLAVALGKVGLDIHVLTSASANYLTGVSDRPTVHAAVRDWGWRCLGTIEALLDVIKPDVVHIQYQTASFGLHPAINCLPAWLRLRRSGTRSAITFHDLRVPYLFPKAGRVRWWATVAPAQWSDATIVTNPEDYQRLRTALEDSWVGNPVTGWLNRDEPRRSGDRKVYVVPIGSNILPDPPPAFDRMAWRAEIGVDEGEALLIYFGFLNASKGGETLVHALDRLIRSGVRCRLVMLGEQVGASDPTNVAYLARVKGLVEELDLREYIAWTGFLPAQAVSAYLLAADAAVLPYRDGASFRRGSLMAALAHGVPIVTTEPVQRYEAPGFPVLIDGVSARLVPPDDPEAVADAVRGLISRRQLRLKLGQGGRSLTQLFTWDRIAAQTVRIYDELLETR
jgi:glycosyltransferase involved in cell wall biosynthesis